MIYFFDTNICIHILNGSSQCVVDKLEKIGVDAVAIPTTVAAELAYGAFKSTKRDYNLNRLREFIRLFPVVGFDSAAIEIYGEIRADLERKGTPIGANDYFIAATVKANGGVLVTNNTKEFSRVSELFIEDWTQ